MISPQKTGQSRSIHFAGLKECPKYEYFCVAFTKKLIPSVRLPFYSNLDLMNILFVSNLNLFQSNLSRRIECRLHSSQNIYLQKLSKICYRLVTRQIMTQFVQWIANIVVSIIILICDINQKSIVSIYLPSDKVYLSLAFENSKI